jgi:glucosamine--fructose-6-phosphate aminotransferase (isomerizing)
VCGIIGYLGEREATPVLVESLKRLEYRGYDSAGIAVLESASGRTNVTKSEQKVDDLIAMLKLDMPSGTLGVGHTRWATHGRPTLVNAHPHTDCHGRIVVVHNGIIENFAELKEELVRAGHEFASDTDTEVVPHLIEEKYRGDLVVAVRAALARVRGAYALAIFSLEHPDLLIGARLNAPLVVGIGDREHFLASDITAIIPYTKKALILGEGEVVAIRASGPDVTTIDGQPVEPRIIHVDWDVSQAQKGGFAHFMLKEIHETPEAVANVLRGRVTDKGIGFDELGISDAELAAFHEVRLLGMGTSLHAGLIGAHVVEEWAGVRSRAEDSSEFRYRRPTVGPETLTVLITQSGETADTLAGLQQAHDVGSPTVAVTNVVASSAARDAAGAIYLHAGPEIGVASTKTFVSHVISLYLLALKLARARGELEEADMRLELAELTRLPEALGRVLASSERIAQIAGRYRRFQDFMYVGRGLNHAVALEGALKLKEISYLHAEGHSGGELKHGPIALLDDRFPVVAVCTQGPTLDKMMSNVHEVVARDAPVLALVTEGDRSLDGVVSDTIEVPASDEAATAVLASVALQLFAYHIAVELGRDVDQPRNLAKSVTVE